MKPQPPKMQCFTCGHFADQGTLHKDSNYRWPQYGKCSKYRMTYFKWEGTCPNFYNTGENCWVYCGDAEFALRALQW